MPKIVQFTHPGGEHKPDKQNKYHKSWNTRKHQRKFLLCDGKYIKNDQLDTGELIFWGEWEPPSFVTELVERPSVFHPKWLHIPYLPIVIPNSNNSQINFQNTDPYVFDNAFKYFVCKQYKPKNNTLTALSKLERGSMILFGSTGNQKNSNAFFQLDTVFVVSEYIEYDASDSNALLNCQLDAYRDVVYKMAFPNPTEASLKLRLYIGATFNNPVNGMYCYSPSKVWNNQKCGFPRIVLKDMEYITNNLNAAPKITEASLESVIAFWEKIKLIVFSQGCVEGLNFNFKVQ